MIYTQTLTEITITATGEGILNETLDRIEAYLGTL
jgi:hypothetical protein